MKTKLMLSLLLVAPVLAEEIATAPTEIQLSEADQTKNNAAMVQNILRHVDVKDGKVEVAPTCLIIEVRVAKDASMDEQTWADVDKKIAGLVDLLKTKNFEQAEAMINQIRQINAIHGLVTVALGIEENGADAKIAFAMGNKGEGDCRYLTHRINKSDVQPETWNDVLQLTLNTFKTNGNPTFEEFKQMLLEIAKKTIQ